MWHAYHYLFFLIFIAVSLTGQTIQSKNNYSPWFKSFDTKKSDSSESLIKIFPGPLFSLGQNILDEGNFSIALYDEYDQAKNFKVFINEFTFYYGIKDYLSITLYLPIIALNNQRNKKSSGLGNILPQLEYVYYLEEFPDAYNRGTIFAGTTFPVIQQKNPPLGSPSWGVLIGSTACHNSTHVYAFGSAAALLFMHDKNRWGNQYYYEMGIGTTLIHKPNRYHFSTILELNGVYFSSRRDNNSIDPNSGFNVIFFGPGLRLRINKFLFQFGFQMPIGQEFFGHQDDSIDYRLAFFVSWEF